MVSFQKSPDQRFHLPRKVDSITSRTSGNGSDDSDSEEDENERRKYINLQGGHGMLWSSDKLSNHLDLSKSVTQDQKYYEDLVFTTGNVLLNKDARGSRRTSLKHIRCNTVPAVPVLGFDAIQLNNDFEYGFNPKRPSGSKANTTVKLRPISLYSPPPEDRQKIPLHYSNSDATTKYKVAPVLNSVSHASNDYEINLEKELASIRSQPCNLTFQGCEGKVNQKEFAEDLASSRRRRKIRRQLSFDSHPSRKWQKTLSLDSGLATDNSSSFKSNESKLSFKERQERSKSQTLIDIDEGDYLKQHKGYSYSAECLLDDITPASTPEDDTDYNTEQKINCLSENKQNDLRGPQILPKFVDERPPEADVLLSTTSYDINKTEKHKRKGSIPHILSALRLPNKKLKKLIRKKPHDTNIPMKVSHDINPNVKLIETKVSTNGVDLDEHSPKLSVTASIGTDNFSFSESVNTFEQPKKRTIDPPNKLSIDKSISAHSLPKVDEDKESLEFRSTFDRRSRSSCSITTGDKNQSQTQQDSTGLHQRRMSDTVTSWNERSQFGGSPCKRFVRKLLSPVVCGLPSPDRHNLLNGSFTSLRSYDSGSIISETEDSYPHLFDFGSHELMEEMSRIDKELLIRIPWGELSILGWMSPDKYIIAPNIMKMVQFFNRVVMMVTTSILAEETIYRRAKVIQKAIKLALKFRYNKNFNSLKAVLGGLQCTPIFRLKGTWKQVPSRYRRVFRELSELMSEDNNFYKYRMELETSVHEPPSLPFLGNFLTTVAHTHAYVAVHVKYKDNLKTDHDDDGDEDDGSYNTSPSLSPCAVDMNNSEENNETENRFDSNKNKQTDPCIQSSTSKITSAGHIRTDSDDSGVVLNTNRLSRSSDDLETSPREDGLSSPDDDGRKYKFEDVFNNKHARNENVVREFCKCPDECMQHRNSKKSTKQHYSDGDANDGDNIEGLTRASEVITSPVRHGRSISVDNADLLLKHVTDIACIINNRPVARKQRDDLYECELQFWKYQIAAVQYNILPRTYIRRYLMNCPYNTEEENYKLSLKREPPSR